MRGVEPFFMDFEHDHETTIQSGFQRLKDKGWCKPGDPMVVITKMYAGQERKLIDSTQIREIE